MKSCKSWITTAGVTVCSLCREGYPASTKGVLADIAGPVEATTIVKFVCLDCASAIATAIGSEARAASRGGR